MAEGKDSRRQLEEFRAGKESRRLNMASRLYSAMRGQRQRKSRVEDRSVDKEDLESWAGEKEEEGA